MVYTLTLNPALDHILKLENLELGETNRSLWDNFFPGGKGINVSRILDELEVKNIALGFLAGFTGNEIERLLKERHVNMDFIYLKEGHNRINVKLKEKIETEINSSGPEITKEALDELYKKFEKLNDGDYLVLAGSVPDSLGETFYEDVMVKLKAKNINVVVDATSKTLLNTLKHNPILIKPNLRELEEVIGITLNSIEDIRLHAKELKDLGAKNIIVSMGKDGAVLIEENGDFTHIMAPKDKVINTVGSGDSMVAGFTAGLYKGLSKKEAFKLAIACGSATAFMSDLANKKKIEEVLSKISS